MRKISADHIFTIVSEPIKNGVVTVADDGIILNVESAGATFDVHYEGIICPGFINAHCHLELSHLHSEVAEKTGMTGFIKELLGKRTSFSDAQIQSAIEKAEAEMIRNGIVAVGDICNNDSSFAQKAKGNLLYHSFVEVFGLDPSKAEEIFAKGKLLKELSDSKFKVSSSIVPHAPYTMSEKLLDLINEYAGINKSPLTIHNQESLGESELFISNSGVMFETFKRMGIDEKLMRKTGKNSLQSTLPHLWKAEKLLLVHNTYTSKEDLEWITSQSSNLPSQIYFCTCPNANLYIEQKLPDYNLFLDAKVKMCVGTDSLASNWSLSVLDELKTISKHFPSIPLNTLLTWATKNAAKFFNFEYLGTIENGKKPGLNLLINATDLKITEKTEVVKLF